MDADPQLQQLLLILYVRAGADVWEDYVDTAALGCAAERSTKTKKSFLANNASQKVREFRGGVGSIRLGQ